MRRRELIIRATLGCAAIYSSAALASSRASDTANVPGKAVSPNAALLIAAQRGASEQVRNLLDQGVGTEVRDSTGATPLIYASGWTPQRFHFRFGSPPDAAGYLEIVRVLLGHHAKVDAVDRTGKTALMLAASAGHEEIVRLLLSAGADIRKQDNAGRTALTWGAPWGREHEVNQKLLAAGAAVRPIEALLLKDGALAARLIRDGASLEGRSPTGKTPLMIAAENSDVEAARALLQRHSTPNARDQDGLTPLICAVGGSRNPPPSSPSVALTWKPWTKYGDNTDSAIIVGLLAKTGAKLDAADAEGRTALSVAAETGDVASMRELLAVGAKVTTDPNHRALLQDKWRWDENRKVVDMLMQHGWQE